jgi:acetyl-CoA C-acetyltransferase
MTQVIILSATRTPLGSFQGGLSGVTAPNLGAAAIRGAVALAKIDGDEVTDAIMGNVLQAGLGQAPARQAAVLAGLPSSVRCATVNKVCGSSIQAVMNGAHALAVGHSEMVVAGGMENMSASPYLLPGARTGYRMGNQQAIDSMIHDGLWDPYSNSHMGSCAEECAKKYGFSREQQDGYAIASFQRANAAQASGLLDLEISPVMTKDARGAETSMGRDEVPDKVNYSKIPTLRPAFDSAGTVTAANASSISDGAAALVLATSETANARGLEPLGRLVSFGSHSQDPLWFTTAPVRAAQMALQRAGWSAANVDLWEVNEAFAVVPMAFMQELEVTHARLNVRGGAISLGHPIGASGARILVTLLAALRERGLRRGVAAICIGGGEAIATCVELIA